MIGHFFSKIIGPIVLALIFYAVVTPIGVVLRALGRDPLRLRRNAAADSYWITRAPPGSTRAALKDQFLGRQCWNSQRIFGGFRGSSLSSSC
jgi:hypothetical protein